MSPLTTVTICVSENVRAMGLEARTCRAQRTVVIRNAVYVGGAHLGPSGGATLRMMTVGRLRAPKDFVTLVRALALLPPGSFEAVIVGDGPDREKVEAELRRLALGRSVELAGELWDVTQLLATADVFMLSTASEGLPVSILEAMAAGLPVATAVGGVPEVVVDGDPGLRRRMGAAGRARALELFDLPSFHRAHVDLYCRELIRRGLAAPVLAEATTDWSKPEVAGYADRARDRRTGSRLSEGT